MFCPFLADGAQGSVGYNGEAAVVLDATSQHLPCWLIQFLGLYLKTIPKLQRTWHVAACLLGATSSSHHASDL